MPETVMDHVVQELKRTGSNYYPERGDLRNVRVVGHTPKSDHYIYDIVIDFADGNERTAAKVYRAGKTSSKARELATTELKNLQFAHEVAVKKNLTGIP